MRISDWSSDVCSSDLIDGAMDAPQPPLGWSDIRFLDPIEGPDAARALAVRLPDGSRLVVAAGKENIERIDAIIVSLFGVAPIGRRSCRARVCTFVECSEVAVSLKKKRRKT